MGKAAFHVGQTRKEGGPRYVSLGELCEAEGGFGATIDRNIAGLASGIPRAALWLANQLIEQHTLVGLPDREIRRQSWDRVEEAWYTEQRYYQLGLRKAHNFFRAEKNKIYFELGAGHSSIELALTQQEIRLMHCLVDAHGGIVERGVLKKCGWDAKDLQFVLEETLNTAVQRLNRKLNWLLKAEGISPRKWILTLRGRGYRLFQGRE